MNIFNKRIGRFPLGVWIAIIALLILFLLAWAGQAYSLLDSACRYWGQNHQNRRGHLFEGFTGC